MKYVEYRIEVKVLGKVRFIKRYVEKINIFSAFSYFISNDARPHMEISVTGNALEAISGDKQTMKEICKFINKVAPHYEAKVV